MWGFIAGLILGIWIGMIIMAERAKNRLRGRNP
jgi:uncharacterized membrane-anchored protein YhcB (DUF1043 family)